MSKRADLAILLTVAVIAGLILLTLLGTDHPVLSESWVRGTVAGLGIAGPLAVGRQIDGHVNTPGTAASARSTRPTQEAQDIP